MTSVLKRTSELLHLVLPYAPQCPDFVAEKMIRLAAIEFAERTRSWRLVSEIEITEIGQSIDILTSAKDDGDFGLTIATSSMSFPVSSEDQSLSAAVIHEIQFVEMNGRKLDPVMFTSLVGVGEGQAQYFTQINPDAITIIPFETGTLGLSLYLKPSTASEIGTVAGDPLFDRFNVIPAHYVSMFGEVLSYGALAKILEMPGEPWSDGNSAMRYAARFEKKIKTNASFHTRGQQRAPRHTLYRDF